MEKTPVQDPGELLPNPLLQLQLQHNQVTENSLLGSKCPLGEVVWETHIAESSYQSNPQQEDPTEAVVSTAFYRKSPPYLEEQKNRVDPSINKPRDGVDELEKPHTIHDHTHLAALHLEVDSEMAKACLLFLILKICGIHTEEEGRSPSGWEDQWKRNDSQGFNEVWKQQLPKSIIIGVRKGGTRALLEMLSLHPQVAAAHSEVHFFNLEENYRKGLDWYKKQMPVSHHTQITVEKTPGYFSSLKAPERIYTMDSSVKLLLIVRDPVERLVSDYTQILHNRKAQHKPYQTLEQILLRGQELNTRYKAVQRSLYALHLARWLEFFPSTQIHVVDGGGLIREPLSEMRHVESFLGLEPYLGPDNFYFNQTKGFYCLQARGHQHCLDQSKGRPHPAIDELLLEQLCTYFSEHNENFFAMVGRTFNWC